MTTEENSGALPPALPPPVSAPSVGYCRACGKGLTAETVRYAAGTLYCAEHAPAGSAATDNPYTSATASMAASPATGSLGNNPALAFVLGLLIPGVGAVYNGQYAKGLAHAVVFGLLIKMTDADGVFGFLIPVFALYMAFEAMHTAKRRAAGLPVDEFSGVLGDGRNTAPIGPIILIGLGVLFLLINFDLVNFRYLVRWWPLGLIALGAYMLYARVSGAGGSGADRA